MAAKQESLSASEIAELQIGIEEVVKRNAEMLDNVRKHNDVGITNYWVRQLALTQRLHKKLEATFRVTIERDPIDGE